MSSISRLSHRLFVSAASPGCGHPQTQRERTAPANNLDAERAAARGGDDPQAQERTASNGDGGNYDQRITADLARSQ
jgi:hypothetical protein